MKDRLVQILEHYNLSSAQFAELIGVQRSSISHILSGRNKPSYDFLVKVIEHLKDLNSEWLLTGRGEILKQLSNSTLSTAQKDLFEQNTVDTPKSNKNKDYAPPDNIDIAQKNHASKLSEFDTNSSINPKVTNVNSVKFIVFVYEDNSFELINKK